MDPHFFNCLVVLTTHDCQHQFVLECVQYGYLCLQFQAQIKEIK